MGNRLCKKKGDVVDNANIVNDADKSSSTFDRIINRLHLKPAAWKSETQLHKKGNNRSKSEERRNGESIFYTKPFSKSSDWTEVDLEVPSKEDDHIHLRNPKLNLIFDNDKGTPTPPPRKQHNGSNFMEKIEKIATRSIQAFQGDRNKDVNVTNQVPVEEPLMVKKKINYNCPICDSDEKNHNRDHHHSHKKNPPNRDSEPSLKKPKNSNKRLKNLSVISLPNYTELKLSLAQPSDIGHQKAASKTDLNTSRLSLQHSSSKKLTSSQSTGKLDSYITRCRSFGSIFPQQLKKLKLQKTKPEDITSDDSFGPLEDWDVGLIEHYNPKDTSLPRPRKPAVTEAVLKGIEGLVVPEQDIVEQQKPKRPVRRSESLVKKMNKGVSRETPEDICLTPPPSPVNNENTSVVNKRGKVSQLAKNFEDDSIKYVQKPSVIRRNHDESTQAVVVDTTKRESVTEHSSLMKILQEFSIKDKQERAATNCAENESNMSSLTPSLVEFEKTLNNSLMEDFINAEKRHTRAVCS